MEKEKVTPIKGHIYHVTFQNFEHQREYLLLFLDKDPVRTHWKIIASLEEVNNNTVDIYSSYNTYSIKEVQKEDLPLYINWYQKPLFSKLFNTVTKGI